jgi:NAD(P)-dependent dehydrogenase (short-subunit alcohol dehydrogenase family)
MVEDLHGKTALVTGAAVRLGRHIALALAEEGVNIILHYRDSEAEAQELRRLLEARGVSVWPLAADFDQTEASETLIRRSLDAAGSLHYLINSASIFPADRIASLSFDNLLRCVRVNAWAPFALCREFHRLIGRGKIVNLLDTRIADFDWQHVGYILSKQMLAHLTRMLAVEFAPSVSVNGVAPGLILPPRGQDASYLERLKTSVPLQRYGNADDVASAVLFLLRSRFITGEIIHVDGGRHLKEYSHGQNHHP